MSKDELVSKLNAAIANTGDKERAHLECDLLLLEYIDDARVSELYSIKIVDGVIEKDYFAESTFWYS